MPTRVLVAGVLLAALGAGPTLAIDGIVSSRTYRPEIVGRVGVVAAGRHFAAEAGMRMLARGGNAIDAGVAATFPAGGSGVSPLGLGGEGSVIVYLADRAEALLGNSPGPPPAAG